MAAIRQYVRACVHQHGMHDVSKTLGVSRHTLWRFLERNQAGRTVPKAVLAAVGDSLGAVDAATVQVIAAARAASSAKPAPAPEPELLPQGQHDALVALCAAPLTAVSALACFTRVPTTTLRGRLQKLTAKGLVDCVSHQLDSLSPQPQRRCFPTETGIGAAARADLGLDAFLRTYPVSRRWFRLLTERLDAVAVLYHVAALVANANRHGRPARVDHYRQGPYDMLITLARGRSVALCDREPPCPHRTCATASEPWSNCTMTNAPQ